MREQRTASGIETKVFAKGYCFVKIFVFFLLGCVIGTYYEEIFWYIRFHEWVDRQGVFTAPSAPSTAWGYVPLRCFWAGGRRSAPG